MSNKQRVYLDSSVVLAAAKGNRSATAEALRLFESEDLHRVASNLVLLETLAPELANGAASTVSRMERLFTCMDEWVDLESQDCKRAFEIASQTPGLKAADALHMAVCLRMKLVFANAERPASPPNTCKLVKSLSIGVPTGKS